MLIIDRNNRKVVMFVIANSKIGRNSAANILNDCSKSTANFDQRVP